MTVDELTVDDLTLDELTWYHPRTDVAFSVKNFLLIYSRWALGLLENE